MGPLVSRVFRYSDAQEMALAWRLRDRVFRQDLQWAVSSADQLEIDDLDSIAIHLGVWDGQTLVAYLRLLNCAGPTLLGRSFPQLGEQPTTADVWEVSRFAAESGHHRRAEASRMLVSAGLDLGRELGAETLIAVTEPAFERYLRSCGVRLRRLAGPLVVGRSAHGDVHAVVIQTHLGRQAAAA